MITRNNVERITRIGAKAAKRKFDYIEVLQVCLQTYDNPRSAFAQSIYLSHVEFLRNKIRSYDRWILWSVNKMVQVYETSAQLRKMRYGNNGTIDLHPRMQWLNDGSIPSAFSAITVMAIISGSCVDISQESNPFSMENLLCQSMQTQWHPTMLLT